MLKLPKGLKKKKKGKKSKKDQELFNEEELEQYRREHQKQNQDLGHQSTSENPSGEAGADDEWQKFKALTAGVDSIIKQKQEELDHIKSTSFFQRVSTPSEKKREEEQKEKEEQAVKDAVEKEKQEELAKQEAEKKADVLAGAVVELSESESEEEEDIFDTAYIDVIAAAEVGLVNVDSPVEEEADGPDPFDTSYADKVIKGPEVSKRGKKLVNIGSAVEVLTGRVDTVSTVSSSRRPRRGPQNLLLENFDDAGATEADVVPEPPKNTLLDGPADEIPDIPIDLSVSLHLQFQQQKREEEEKKQEESVNLDEFDDLKNKKVEDDDEFAQLAAESLTHTDHINQVTGTDLYGNQGVEGDWAFFENKGKQPPPRPAFGPNIPAAVSDEDLSFQEDSSDPFDTAFVTKILPATLAEDADFDPRAEFDEPEPPKVAEELFSPNFEGSLSLRKFEQTDLLRGSNTDLSQICVDPIAPTAGGEVKAKVAFSDDPFDTSSVETIVAPGKTELKFLEKEFLTDSNLKKSLSDPDFDPRAEEEEEVVPQSPATINYLAERKSSLALNITPAGSRLVSFSVPNNDLLRTEEHSKGHQKPLTPYYTKAPSIGENDNEDPDKDPFDTSYLSEIKPSDIELNLIEKEILQESHLKHSLSDPDFDPRAITPQPPAATTHRADLLGAADNEFSSKVLTPAVEVKEFEYRRTPDPFDTSAVSANIQPGQAELKVLVSEFVPPSQEESDLLADTDQSIFAGKILTPQPSNSIDLEEEDIDPFDTSFANNIQPGQAEIRVIETELIHN